VTGDAPTAKLDGTTTRRTRPGAILKAVEPSCRRAVVPSRLDRTLFDEEE
jgi:hypothetical protein